MIHVRSPAHTHIEYREIHSMLHNKSLFEFSITLCCNNNNNDAEADAECVPRHSRTAALSTKLQNYPWLKM